jgi:parallel beta-helix repeat protein
MPVINGRAGGNVMALAADGAWIEGFVVKNAGGTGSGIRVTADGCTIVGNDVTDCPDGIYIEGARDIAVIDNHLYANDRAGVYVTGSSGIRVAGNHAHDNLYGVYMERSALSVIENNNCSNNIDIEIYIENITDSIVRGNIATSERIKAKKIDGIGIRYGDNVTFDGNYVSRHYYGIKVYESHDCLVENNVADGSGVNIRLDFETHDTTLRNNTVKNGVDNIYLHCNAYSNLVEDNTCYNGREGIYMLESAGNTVRGNDVFNNTIGIRMISTTGNTITGNYAYDNSANIIEDGGNNTISGNYEYPAPGKPRPTDTVPPGSVTPLPTAAPSGGNPILDFISSIINMIFH